MTGQFVCFSINWLKTRNLVFINNEVRKYGHKPIKYDKQKKLYIDTDFDISPKF